MPQRHAPGLTVGMLVREPPAQVAAMASLFREVADEIIVCVDSRVDPDLIWPLETVADRLMRVQHSHPFFNSTRWLHDLASHEWVFLIDGDEAPSRALLDRLGQVDSFSDRITHAYVQRRWIWKDTKRYLVSEPWREDPQLRLSPRDSRLMGWRTGLHDPVDVVGPGVMFPEAIYHLDLFSRDLGERIEKVERYDKLTTDRLPGFQRTINDSYYLPENRTDELQWADIPPEDQEILEHVLFNSQLGVRRSPHREITILNGESVRESQLVPENRDRDHRCRVEILEPAATVVAGQQLRVSVVVRNDGDWDFPLYNGLHGVAVGWNIVGATEQASSWDLGRSGLGLVLKPGESVLVPCSVTMPTTEGRYELSFSVVNEGVKWFPSSARCELSVLPAGRFLDSNCG